MENLSKRNVESDKAFRKSHKRPRRSSKKSKVAGAYSLTLGSKLSRVVPESGAVSVAGKRRVMEDAVCVCPQLCCPEIAGYVPVHYFAVFDGHGGSHVSTLCQRNFYSILKEQLIRMAPPPRTRNRAWPRPRPNVNGVAVPEEEDEEDRLWRRVMKKAFRKMDKVALSTCSCGVAIALGCGCDNNSSSALVGSTATVAVVTPNKIIVANCGDSRAVLCRGYDLAIPLTVDHKLDRPDELARIENAGGRVINYDGSPVQGFLSVTRAIGDKPLKPIVISEPEITITRRDPADECLILASDGLWDVMSSSMACKIALEAFEEGSDVVDDILGAASAGLEGELSSQCSRVADLLTYLALGKESNDNISVIVVDLKNRQSTCWKYRG